MEERLLPMLDKVYGARGFKMVLVLDNAPCHHKREVVSLQGLSKKSLPAMMEAGGMDQIELPMTGARFDMIQEEGKDGTDLQDRGKFVELNFRLHQRASQGWVRVTSCSEPTPTSSG